MRKIDKRAEPIELTAWRAANQADPSGGGINFSYDLLRQDRYVTAKVMGALLEEQGRLCRIFRNENQHRIGSYRTCGSAGAL